MIEILNSDNYADLNKLIETLNFENTQVQTIDVKDLEKMSGGNRNPY